MGGAYQSRAGPSGAGPSGAGRGLVEWGGAQRGGAGPPYLVLQLALHLPDALLRLAFRLRNREHNVGPRVLLPPPTQGGHGASLEENRQPFPLPKERADCTGELYSLGLRTPYHYARRRWREHSLHGRTRATHGRTRSLFCHLHHIHY